MGLPQPRADEEFPPVASLLAENERLKRELAVARARIGELEARADVDPLLDIPAVAARLGVSSKTVRRHIDRGDLAVHHIGRLLRVSEEDLASFVARRRQIQSKNNV